MQNIPGLSFFDGLTKSRGSQSGASGRHSSRSGQSPIETPLDDAAPFAQLRNTRSTENMSHPLGANEQELTDSFDGNGSTAASLPTASFSRRAATVSSFSTAGSPVKRTSSSTSTSSRSSILPREGIFSVPALTRKPSSISSNDSKDRTGGVSDEPTTKDVTLMAQGTTAYAMLKRIQEHPIELADIIRLLVTKKAILALPTCASSTDEQSPERSFFEDHVIIPESNHGESLFVTLSGVKGVLRPGSSSISIIGMASGKDFSTIATDASGPVKRSFFDNISKGDDTSADLGSKTIEFKLVNSSKRPVVIFVESVGSVQALLLDNPLTRPEQAPTPIIPLASGLSKERNFSAGRRTTSSSSSILSSSGADIRDPLPKLPKIASNLPLEWDSVVRDLESFVIKLKKSPLSNTDRYANEFQRKYDNVRQRFETYGTASGLKHRWSEQDFDELQQWVEAWLCREMYSTIFAQPNSEDYFHDEQLQAKIAALNFLDLTLEHLGFVLEHPEDVEHIAQVVREGGLELQKLGQVKSPSDKMNVVLSCHRVVIDALNREPAVQDMLAATVTPLEAEEVTTIRPVSENTAVDGELLRSELGTTVGKTGMARNKRLSMPRILMDGDLPRAEPDPTTILVHSPRIPMDEGYERPSLSMDEPRRHDEHEQNPEQLELKSDDPVNSPELADTPVLAECLSSSEGASTSTSTETEPSATSVTSTDINPTDVPLPDSPFVEAVEESPKTPSATPSIASSVATRKQYSADVLIPLLIFSVVKSNPPMLISNLRYIQRFKVQDHLAGELAYCLTNMMAVVSFLETLDPQALGLSSDIQVISDTSEIRFQHGAAAPAPLINLQEGLDQTKALGQKVSQEIAGVAEEGLKVISDVVQDGYSKFFGRFLTPTDGHGPRGQNVADNKARSAATSLAASAAADAATMARSSSEDARTDGKISGLVTPAVHTSNVTTLSVGSRGVGAASADTDMDKVAKERVLAHIQTIEGPQFQFMACTNADDLRLSDVKLLLQDYQRIGKAIEGLKYLAQ
ncbi:hypothetical protein BG004_006047 [Podila humilis]|nr:hypothetical protein BG004_006047 [Podila humilis]